MTDSPCAVTVTDQRGLTRQAHGRAARMLWLVLVYQDRINAARRGKLTFSFGDGEKVLPDLLEQLEGN